MRQNLTLFIYANIFTVIFLLPYSNDVYAHKVNMFTNVEGSTVFIEGYFSDGTKAMRSQVIVYAPDGKKLLEGKTDEKGEFSFPIPQKTDLRIVLNAELGHRTEYLLKASELAGATADDASPSGDPSSPGDQASVSNAELSQVVDRAVGQAIRPLMREVSELKERRGFSDILGGIGFIFGIFGIVLFLMSRKVMAQQKRNAEQKQ